MKPGAIPWVTYTDPELAQAGETEASARQKGLDIAVTISPFARNDRAQTERDSDGFVKVISTKKGRILGATIVGAQAGELIQVWCLAIAQGLKLSAMAGVVVPYPTRGEAGKRAAGDFYAPTPVQRTHPPPDQVPAPVRIAPMAMEENTQPHPRMPGLLQSLSARLLVLTVFFIMLSEILIFAPSAGRFRVTYLEERIQAGHLAILALMATPDNMVSEDLAKELLFQADAYVIGLKRPDGSKLMLDAGAAAADRRQLRSARPRLLHADRRCLRDIVCSPRIASCASSPPRPSIRR